MSIWPDFAIKGLAKGVDGLGSYFAQRAKAKAQKQWTDYNNKLLRMQNAVNQNTATSNELAMVERSHQQGMQLQKSKYLTEATVEVSAAATGTTGRSVDRVLAQVGRNAAEADQRRLRDLEQDLYGVQLQRESSEMNTAMQMDHSTAAKPNMMLNLLGFGADVGQLWSSEGMSAKLKSKAPAPKPKSSDPWYNMR